MPNEKAIDIIKKGSVRLMVIRKGMRQFQIFKVKRVKVGNYEFPELFIDKVIEPAELMRLAEETGLPIEAENGRAFPKGKSAKDFIGL